jgi:hypothetical protein
MGSAPIQGDYGHSYTSITDTDTGQESIVRAGSNGYDAGPYGANVILDRPTPGVDLQAERTDAAHSIDRDTAHNPASAHYSQLAPSVTIHGNAANVLRRADQLVNRVNSSHIPYQPRSNNSNRFTNFVFGALTGHHFSDNRFPGAQGQLPVNPPGPIVQPKPPTLADHCTEHPGAC